MTRRGPEYTFGSETRAEPPTCGRSCENRAHKGQRVQSAPPSMRMRGATPHDTRTWQYQTALVSRGVSVLVEDWGCDSVGFLPRSYLFTAARPIISAILRGAGARQRGPDASHEDDSGLKRTGGPQVTAGPVLAKLAIASPSASYDSKIVSSAVMWSRSRK